MASTAPSPLKPPPANAAIAQQLQILAEQRTEYTGPLPPPAMLREYGEIVEGGAERIFAQFEQQSSHRRALETFVIHHDARRADHGLYGGIFALIAILTLAGYALFLGNTPVALALVAADLITGGGSFLYTDHLRRNERKERVKMMTGQVPQPPANHPRQ